MKAIIASNLKAQIESHLADINAKENYLQALKDRRQSTPVSEREELEDLIEDTWHTISTLESQLSDFRYALYYTLRGFGYSDRELDIFKPETSKALEFIVK